MTSQNRKYITTVAIHRIGTRMASIYSRPGLPNKICADTRSMSRVREASYTVLSRLISHCLKVHLYDGI